MTLGGRGPQGAFFLAPQGDFRGPFYYKGTLYRLATVILPTLPSSYRHFPTPPSSYRHTSYATVQLPSFSYATVYLPSYILRLPSSYHHFPTLPIDPGFIFFSRFIIPIFGRDFFVMGSWIFFFESVIIFLRQHFESVIIFLSQHFRGTLTLKPPKCPPIREST